jgi:hypothetical protein
MAEQEGFEPSIRETRIPDFESGAFDHSAIAPRVSTAADSISVDSGFAGLAQGLNHHARAGRGVVARGVGRGGADGDGGDDLA